MPCRILMVTLFIGLFSIAVNAEQSALKQSIDTTEQTRQMGIKSQAKVDKLASLQQALLNEYQALLQKSEYQKSYNQELRTLQTEQVLEIESLKQQIKDIALTKQRLLPLLRDMVQTLEQFIRLDLPFRHESRLTSIDKLQRLLASSSATVSEKYRRVMELYQAENDYNYDLEAYRDSIQLNDQTLSVQVLRIGRSNLYMQTMDGKKTGMWNRQSKKWQLLDDSQALNIRKALRIADKKAAPELLSLPYSTQLDHVKPNITTNSTTNTHIKAKEAAL